MDRYVGVVYSDREKAIALEMWEMGKAGKCRLVQGNMAVSRPSKRGTMGSYPQLEPPHPVYYLASTGQLRQPQLRC